MTDEKRIAPTQRHHADCDAICRYVRDCTGDEVILAFSGGKDAVGAWLQLRRYFTKIRPMYYYLVPGLSFVEEGLAYYEDFFQTKIERYPNPHLYRMLRTLIFQPPERCAVIEDLQLVQFERQDIQDDMRDRIDNQDAYTAMGTRTTDSMMRRMASKKFGQLATKQKTFWPVFDWTNDRLFDELQRAGVKLTLDYELFGRSFDGIDHRFLAPIKAQRPDDYARILEWFPLADLELLRRNLSPETRA